MRRLRSTTGVIGVIVTSVAMVVIGLFVVGDDADTPRDDGDVSVTVSTLELDRDQMPRSADLRNGRIDIQENLWSDDGEQFAVWVDEAGTPYVGRRDRGSDDWAIDDLSDMDGNPLAAPVRDDNHNFMTVARDAKDRLHVTGNMHSDEFRSVRWDPATTGWEDISDQVDAEQATYPKYVELSDETVLLFWRERVADEGIIRIERLAPDADAWSPVGPLIDGLPSGEGPYLHHVAVDPDDDTIHVLFMWREDGHDPDTNTDVGYAQSIDGGRSWETSTGKPLQLPITHDTAETVFPTEPGSGLRNAGGMTVDADGRPHGVLLFDQDERPSRHVHLWYDGERWQRRTLPTGLVDGRPAVAATSDGRVWVLGARGTELRAVDITPGTRDRTPIPLSLVPQGWEPTYDTRALVLHDTIEVLVPDGSRPRVVVFDPVGTGAVSLDEATSISMWGAVPRREVSD